MDAKYLHPFSPSAITSCEESSIWLWKITKATSMYNAKMAISQIDEACTYDVNQSMLSICKYKARQAVVVLFWSKRVNRQLEQPTKKLKLTISHAQDCWHFVSTDQEG